METYKKGRTPLSRYNKWRKVTKKTLERAPQKGREGEMRHPQPS